MKNILYITEYLPYDRVSHAGGQICNYYVKQLAKQNNVYVISFSYLRKKEPIDFDLYGIKNYIFFFDKNPFFFFIYRAFNFIYNHFYISIFPDGITNEVRNTIITKKLKELKKTDYKPDFIICDWTETSLGINAYKKIYPYARYIATEQDVTFLGLYRKYNLEKNIVKKILKRERYQKFKKAEINSLMQFDRIFTLNEKDSKLLIKNGLDDNKVKSIVPYYQQYITNRENIDVHSIIFWGAMDRIENFLSIKWFISNVFSKLDIVYKLYIVGNHPNQELQNLSSDRIIVTGFVKQPEDYFNKCFCMVVPLLLGAGIKIKVLEAMSAGIPVLTNKIGIEGIPAEDKKEYLFCETPEDYKKSIEELSKNTEMQKLISENSVKFIKKQFNLEKSFAIYNKYINDTEK